MLSGPPPALAASMSALDASPISVPSWPRMVAIWASFSGSVRPSLREDLGSADACGEGPLEGLPASPPTEASGACGASPPSEDPSSLAAGSRHNVAVVPVTALPLLRAGLAGYAAALTARDVSGDYGKVARIAFGEEALPI